MEMCQNGYENDNILDNLYLALTTCLPLAFCPEHSCEISRTYDIRTW